LGFDCVPGEGAEDMTIHDTAWRFGLTFGKRRSNFTGEGLASITPTYGTLHDDNDGSNEITLHEPTSHTLYVISENS